jgi:zinc transporter ZupT
MIEALARAPTITDLLAVLGSGGTVLGGVIGWSVRAPSWRRAFENLALGATAGGVCGCLVAFLTYVGAKVAGG